MGMQVELAGDFFCTEYVTERGRVYLLYFFDHRVLLGGADDGVDDFSLIFFMRAQPIDYCAAVVSFVIDHLADLVGDLRDDKERHLLVVAVHHVLDLCRSELEDDRVERFVPAEEQACDQKDHDVKPQDHIKGVTAGLLGYVYRDKICSAGRCVVS